MTTRRLRLDCTRTESVAPAVVTPSESERSETRRPIDVFMRKQERGATNPGLRFGLQSLSRYQPAFSRSLTVCSRLIYGKWDFRLPLIIPGPKHVLFCYGIHSRN